jgi:hypothetical protein
MSRVGAGAQRCNRDAHVRPSGGVTMKRLIIVGSLGVCAVLATNVLRAEDEGPQSWNLANDVLRVSNQISFNQGARAVWYFMEGPSAGVHDPTLYRLLPDYTAPCETNPSSDATGLRCWLNLAALFAGNHLPTVGINVDDTVANPDAGVLIPPRSVFLHPGPTRQAIVAWQSPVRGFVRVTGRVSDLDPSCDNGVIWFVNRGATTIAQGVMQNGGKPQSFEVRRVFVDAGDVLYFVVDAAMEDYACDTTGLDLRIRQ